jgi:hypothetical protein
MPGGAAVFCAAFFNWLAKTGELSGLSCQVRVKCDVLLSGSPAGDAAAVLFGALF